MEDIFHTRFRIPKGIAITEPEEPYRPGDRGVCHAPDTEMKRRHGSQSHWSYLFVHNKKVGAFTDRLLRDEVTHFIHKSITYQRKKDTRGIQAIERPTISGLIFLQGTPRELQRYLNETFPNYHLVNNCSTHQPATIPDSVMQPFMRVLETSPERVRFLLHPFKYYAGGNIKLRITSGYLAGMEGYVIRIDRDRRLVMDVGGMSVAIAGIHCERFEVVEEDDAEKYRQEKHDGSVGDMPTTPVRRLTSLQERIDRELYMPANQQEAGLIADVLDLWKERAAMYLERSHVAEAMEILFFLLEDIDHHYSSLLSSKTLDMSPILAAARRIASLIDDMTVSPRLTEETRQEMAAERDSCLPRFGYLFEE